MIRRSDMIWILLFFVHFSNIYAHADFSSEYCYTCKLDKVHYLETIGCKISGMFHNLGPSTTDEKLFSKTTVQCIEIRTGIIVYYSTAQTWRDSRQNCTLVSQEILCDKSLNVCKKELKANKTQQLAWIDGYVIRSPWYTYDSQIINSLSLEKTLDSFNQKEIGSNCASILQSRNGSIIGHKPCQERLKFICTNCSYTLSNCSEPNYMLTWEESRRKCEEYNSTLILSPANLRIPIDVNHHYWLGYYRNETVRWNKDAFNTETQENKGDILCLAAGQDGTIVQAIDCSLHLPGLCVFKPTDVQGFLNWILFPASFGISVVIGLVLYLLCLIVVLIFKRCRIQNDVAQNNETFKPLSSRKELYFNPKLTEDTQELSPCTIKRSLSTFPMKSKTISGRLWNKGSTLPSEWRLERAPAEYQSDPYLNREPQPLPFHEPSRTVIVHHSCSSLRHLNTDDRCINTNFQEIPYTHVHKIGGEMTDEHDSCDSVNRTDEISHHEKVLWTCKPDAEQTIRYVSNVTKAHDGCVNSPTMKRTSFLFRLNNVLKLTPPKTENVEKSNKTDIKPVKEHTENVELKTHDQKSEATILDLKKGEEDYITMHHPKRQSDNPESGYISMTDPRSTKKVKVDEHGYAEVL